MVFGELIINVLKSKRAKTSPFFRSTDANEQKIANFQTPQITLFLSKNRTEKAFNAFSYTINLFREKKQKWFFLV
jgi:hypothetical protein